MRKIISRPYNIHPDLAASELPPLLQRIFAARGVVSPVEVLYDLDKLLPYSELKNIELAVEHLEQALLAQAKILIIGDFDADGATSTALAIRVLKDFGFLNVAYLVPNRFEFGYGLSTEIVAYAARENKPDIILTVDNGISNLEGVARANELGIKVIITDHHLAPETLPAAAAIVNPNQVGDAFQSKNLAGVGVIFYVLLALRARLHDNEVFQKLNLMPPNLAQYLDLVALGTVADLVTLDRNNRLLVQQGLKRIREERCSPGIKALLSVAKRNPSEITAADLGFAVAPRLNAAGRLDDMSLGIECLITDDTANALQFAKKLNQLNETRKEIETGMQAQAIQALALGEAKTNTHAGVCIFDPAWHVGIVGILASRIKERLNRPVIAFAPSGETGELKGSGRSVSGLHLRDILNSIAMKYPSLIKRFGGHALAAGLAIQQEDYEKFGLIFALEVARQLKGEILPNEIHTDGELVASDISLITAKLLQNAGPWGQGFAEPHFHGIFNLLQQNLLAEKHLKMLLAIPNEHGAVFNAIHFNADLRRWPNVRCTKVQLVYRLNVNNYNDRHYLQLLVQDLREV